LAPSLIFRVAHPSRFWKGGAFAFDLLRVREIVFAAAQDYEDPHAPATSF